MNITGGIFEPKVGQIASHGTNPGLLQIIFLASQNVLKSNLKKSRICLICANQTQLKAQIWYSSIGVIIPDRALGVLLMLRCVDRYNITLSGILFQPLTAF